jgi:hypothetical protein
MIEGEAEAFAERFKERFRWCALDLLGVAGKDGIMLSSLLGGRLKSPVTGWAVDVGLETSDNERDLGERDTLSRWANSDSDWDWDCDCDSCWLSLLSNAWAEELRPGTDGRTCAILQKSMMGGWPNQRHCPLNSSHSTLVSEELYR